jgi:hypothetical protein
MSWETQRIFCQGCLTYHARNADCPASAPQVLPSFEGTATDYEIATRGTPVGRGQLDDAGDGTVIVRWGMREYRVTYSMGVPTKVEPFGLGIEWVD